MSVDVAALQDEINVLKKENRAMGRKLKETEYLMSSYEQYAVFQKSIYESLKKQKTEQDIYLHMMFNNTPNIILILDAEMMCVLGTKKTLHEIGIDADALTGKDFTTIFSPIMPQTWVLEMHGNLREALDSGKPIHKQCVGVLRGKERCYKINIIPFHDADKRICGVMIAMHDETDLHEMVIAAESSNRAKTNFLAKMSHEIRTPMSAIAGMAELILREQITGLVREHTLSIKQASGNLMAIINDILDFSKIESGKLEIIEDEYIFGALINDVISIIRTRVLDKQVFFVANIDCNLPNRLIGDETRIRQIFLNLLSNAFKYCDQGFVSVNVGYESISDSEVCLICNITDSGIGIKPEDYDRLFYDFVQLDRVANKDVEGTGLGLVITKNLCEAMSGSIAVDSVYGEGSTFTVRIPQKFKVYEKFASVGNAEDKNVLIYEMRDVYSKSIMQTLSNLGVSSTLVLSQSQFSEALLADKFTHIFASSFLLDNIEKIIKNSGTDIPIALLAEYGGRGVVNRRNVRTLEMPVHAISIANVLDGISEDVYAENPFGSVRFTAPLAQVLIVDDLITNLRVAEGLMLPYCMQIDTCRRGMEAIEAVRNNAYDIVFMDHMMPEMDGIETTLKIRELGETKGYEYLKTLPIVALTANAMIGVKEMFLQNGFNDFLAKPVEITKLNAILEAWLPKEKLEPYTASAAKQDTPVFEIHGIDIRAGIYMTGGSEANYLRVLSAFYRDGVENISRLREYCRQGGMKQYAACVHAVKGAAASIGAAKLANLAKTIEPAARNEDLEYVQKHNENFLCEFEAILNNISYVVSADSKNNCGKNKDKRKDGSALQIKEYITRLKSALDGFDIEIADEILTELQGEDLDKAANETLTEVADKILICEYEQALDIINAFEKSLG